MDALFAALLATTVFPLCFFCGFDAVAVEHSGQQGSARDRAAAVAAKAEEHAAAGRLNDAIRLMEEAERIAPAWAELKVNLAALKSQAADFDGAIAAARAALAIDQTLDGAWLNLGLAQLKSGDAAGAVVSLERFGDRRESPPVAVAALGLALFRVGRVADAAVSLQQAVDAGIRDEDVLLALGHARLRRDDPDGALKLARLLMAQAGRSARAFMLLGDVEDARHDWEAAEAAYRAALAADALVLHGHYSLGLMLYKQRRYDEAATHLDRELSASPDYAPALRYRAEIELDRGNADAAVPLLQRLTTTAPRNADGWRLLGRARLDQHRHADAIAALERARELAPEDPTVHFLLGRALTSAGRRAEAQAAFARAAELNERLRERLERRVSGKKR